MLKVRICVRWSCPTLAASSELGVWNQERVKPRFRCSEFLSFSRKSARSNAFCSLPFAWTTRNSGGSRKRPVFNPSTAMKLPSFALPAEKLNPPLAVPNEPYEVVMLPVGFWPRPERVVTLMTRLVLPPYSAGGAPEIASSDWMESMGIWLEKTLLCWSVMGWPSTENEFSAWSPMPCTRPFESATAPGEASVTSELTDDDWLSRGNFSNSERSMSVCGVDSVSISSPPCSVTFTDSLAAATCNATATFTVTCERTSTSCV